MKLYFSFKKKIILAIISIIVFFGVFAVVEVFRVTQKTIADLATQYLNAVVIQQETAIGAIFDNSASFVHHLASQKIVVDYLQQNDPPTQDEGLLEHFENFDADKRYQAIYVMDRAGLTLTSTDPSFTGQNYAFRDYFKEAMAGKPVLDAAIGITSGKFGYYASYPVKTTAGEAIGVVVVKMKAELLNEALEPKVLSSEGSVMLTDKYGVVIQSSDPTLLYRSLGTLPQEAVQEIASTKRFGGMNIRPLQYEGLEKDIQTLQNPKTTVLYNTEEKRDEIVGVVKVHNTPFFIVIRETTQLFVVAARKVAQTVSLFVLIAALAAALILTIMVSRLLRPLGILKNAAAQMGKGTLNQKVVIRTGDEFEELGEAFNRTSERLGDLYEHMEAKIWERTADFEKFKLAVEAASDHVVITDIDGRIVYANKAAELTTGYSKNEMIGNRPSLWGRQMPTAFYSHMWQVIKTEKKVFNEEVTNKRKTGERYIAELYIAPLLMDNDTLYGFVGIERDITAHKEADRVRSEFVSIASHQLRTPLAVINWYIEMLMKGEVGPVNAEQNKYLEQVRVASRRMVELVNSLLSVSRIDLGKLEMETELLTLTEVADTTIEDIHPQIQEKQLNLVKQYEKDLPQVNADPGLIRVVFQNLISNAIKYTPEGGTITVTIKKQDKDTILVMVTDTGYGIPKAQQSKIFSKFFRADNAREKVPDGNGLGLYIVKSIIDKTNGSIWFTSEEDRGTTFFVTIPLSGMQKNEQNKKESEPHLE